MVRVVLKVRNKGVLILPKSLREVAGIGEGEVAVEAREGEIVIRPLKPRIVDIDHRIVEEILGEESRLEEEKFKRILRGVRG
ncbi:AbrB/MazE/SpoVT family DNA-binding domain-containing protein [Candidatus Bathyarchaeota archaeon]|nr:AbrB/MazE/SpoVT family DNA-binding domain-containing protein [Candidatus Bathyarchaeota archaeon]MBS7617484.1 AbrB/MazE/SpoVT family DNA-binding domain-containing protein [Candidatus Bathyarchaeota archaeon]